jgi:hypothetical protein
MKIKALAGVLGLFFDIRHRKLLFKKRYFLCKEDSFVVFAQLSTD